MKEKYIPSEAEKRETKKAEGMLSEEQRESSEIRAKYHEQVQPPWESFVEENIDENFERKPPTPEQVKDIDQRVVGLGEIFKDSNLNWHLDGAINISLLNGKDKEGKTKYIGNHKDIDISVEKEELAQLESQLLKKGYGFFLSRTDEETKNKVLTRVNHEDFLNASPENRQVGAIDKDGKIRTNTPINFLDVHIMKRNADGLPLGYSDVVIPEKWAKPYPIEFQGEQVNISHPGKVLYYKMHSGRNYDTTDVYRLIETGKVTIEDVDDVEKAFESEFSADIERGRKMIEPVVEKLTPEMGSDQIFESLLQQPEFKKSAEQMKDLLHEFAQKIYESDDKSIDAITNIAIGLFKLEERNNTKREEIKTIRRKLEDANKIKQIMEELK